MKKCKSFFVTISFLFCVGLTESCSQPAGPPPQCDFEATTPCNEAVKKMLGIPAATQCEMMRWHLSLNCNSNNQAPETFKLMCEYGKPKQGTKGFDEGSKKIEVSGKCRLGVGIPGNNKAIVYTLNADDRRISLSFLQPDQNLLHLLNDDKSLVNGTGAWSYTLNRTAPVPVSAEKFSPEEIPATLTTGGSDTVGIFDGRTPCNDRLREIKNIAATRCEIIKCRLILLRDGKTGTAGRFILYTIYVGDGDNNRYNTNGKWKLIKGPAALVYKLEPEESKSGPLLLVKADDNILFFVDSHAHFMVGNSYASYTLNRREK